MILFRFCSI